jgi:hypothetical protein
VKPRRFMITPSKMQREKTHKSKSCQIQEDPLGAVEIGLFTNRACATRSRLTRFQRGWLVLFEPAASASAIVANRC